MIAHAERTTVDRCQSVGYDYGAQHKEIVPECNMCGCDRQEPLSTRDRYGFRAITVKCPRCGLVYLSPRLTAAGYCDFYQNWYRKLVSAYHNRRIDAESIEREQQVYAKEWCDWVEPYMPKRLDVEMLDIGGSTGVVASEFCERFGVRCTVVDPSPRELQRAAQRGHTTVCGLAEDMEFSSGINVVGMFQTIDHLLDPGGVVLMIHECLVPGGLALIDIVDCDLVAMRTGHAVEAIKIDHPFYFTKHTAAMMWGATGFEVLDTQTHGDHIRYILKKDA